MTALEEDERRPLREGTIAQLGHGREKASSPSAAVEPRPDALGAVAKIAGKLLSALQEEPAIEGP